MTTACVLAGLSRMWKISAGGSIEEREKMGKFDKYSADVRLAISYAREEAQRVRHRLVGPEHLLMGVLKLHNPLIEGLFASLHVSTASISQALDFVMGHGNKALLSEPT